MWTTLSVSRWICLLTLAVVMLFFAAEGDSEMVGQRCCTQVKPYQVSDGNIKKCYKQNKRDGCLDAYVIITNSDEKICVRPTPPKLKRLLHEGKLECPSDVSKKRRFEVLNDVE